MTPARTQLPCDGIAETKVTLAGSVSVTVTEYAVSGPPFVTVIVNVRFCPVGARPGGSVLTSPRFTENTAGPYTSADVK
jgi:hypothetical protein